jgi:hypothetical protein
MKIALEVEKFIADYRSDIERCWDDTTANTMWRDWSPSEHTVASHGQCGSTSLLLHELLTNNFPDENFYIAAGEVRLLGVSGLCSALDSHVWVDRRAPEYKAITVLDPTADQIDEVNFPPQIIATYDELMNQGILYTPLMHFLTSDEFYSACDHSEARMRTDILRENYAALKN